MQQPNFVNDGRSCGSCGGGIHSCDFRDVISIDNLFFAWKEFRKGKRFHKDVAAFELQLEENLFKLNKELISGRFKLNPYKVAMIQDPKQRTIHIASVRDRVLFQAVYRKLYHLFDPSFIHDVYSSRNSKGTHAGVNRLEEFSRKVSKNFTRPASVLKCDIRKFFDSIDHEILFRLISRKITDVQLLDFIKVLINSLHHTPGKGLPLGNVTSQLFANIYMNELDQSVKHELKAKYYIRYCDDFVIIDRSHALLEDYIFQITAFLKNKLHLDLHPKKMKIRKIHQGIDFLGYVSMPHYRILRTRTKNRMFSKINKTKKMSNAGKISKNHINAVIASYFGILKHCKSGKIKNVICSRIMAELPGQKTNMAKILDGRKVREALLPELIEKVKKLSRAPTLAIIQVGNRPDSDSYIRAKKIFARKIGVNERHIQLSESASEEELIKTIKECNADENIQGIIVQLPLREGINRRGAIEAIAPEKDVDALTQASVEKWSNGTGILPATARGIGELMRFYHISLKGKKVAVIGRSELVGTPIAAMCRNEAASVVVCHSRTVDLAKETREADIIISATGRPGLIGSGHVKKGQIVIDVGIAKAADGKLVGDVDFEAVKDIVAAITPVPGGVGPMTVVGLFDNLVDLCGK